MCLIIDRPAYVDVDEGLLLSAMIDNPDGWGIVAGDGDDLLVRRGLDPAAFWRAYSGFDGMACTIHFRWATHGPKLVKNTHPFVICDGRYAVLHNGVMSHVKIENPLRSDTYHFATRILQPMLGGNPDLFASTSFVVQMEQYIGRNNKVVIVRSDGQRVILNRREGVQHGKLWLSNGNSLPISMDDYWGLEDLVQGASQDEIARMCETDPERMAEMIVEHFNWSNRSGGIWR